MILTHTTKALLAFLATGLMLADATIAAWSPGPSMNASRGFAASVVDPCGNILVIGGMRRIPGDQVILADIEMLAFDGTSYASAWTTLAITLPVPRYLHTAIVANGFLYLIGGAHGYNPGDAILQVDRYDFLSDTWDSASVPPIPFPSIGHASVVDNFGRIWMIGGNVPNANGQVLSTTVVYDPARPQLGWQTMPSLNTGRTNPGAVVDQRGRIWVIGGLDSGWQNHVNTVEILDPCSPDAVWTVSPVTLPAPVSNTVQAVVGADGHIYISGGWANNGYLSNVCRIDPCDSLATWTTLASLSLARNEHTAVLGGDGRIIVAGGEAGGVQSQTGVETQCTRRLLGDINNDGVVDFFDIDAFLNCLFIGCLECS